MQNSRTCMPVSLSRGKPTNPGCKSKIMFFKKKAASDTDLSGLRCDMHSHLIPGIDDGSPDMETSVRLIRGFIELGYKKIITTPHINADIVSQYTCHHTCRTECRDGGATPARDRNRVPRRGGISAWMISSPGCWLPAGPC